MTSHCTRAAALSGAAAVGLMTAVPASACQVPVCTLGRVVQVGCAPGCGPADGATHSTRGFRGDGNGGSALGSGSRSGLFEISIRDFAFLPADPIVKPNQTVRWTNDGLFTHTSTRTPTWDSGFLDPDQFFDHTFGATNSGLRYHYVCTLHFGMEADISIAHFGDANTDGEVNLADFNILAGNFGSSGQSWEQGDFTGDGNVSLADFNLLAGNFGRPIEDAPPPLALVSGFGSLVPEPATLTVALPVLLLARSRRRAVG